MQALIIIDGIFVFAVLILLGVFIFKDFSSEKENDINDIEYYLPRHEFNKYKKNMKFRQYLIDTKCYGKIKDEDLKNELASKIIFKYKYLTLCNKVIKEYDFMFIEELENILKTIEQEQRNRNLRNKEK